MEEIFFRLVHAYCLIVVRLVALLTLIYVGKHLQLTTGFRLSKKLLKINTENF